MASKKVLILAYDFPPYISVGGLRPFSWYKYLKRYDWHPVVVTRNWNIKYNNSLDYVVSSSTNNVIVEDSELGTIVRSPYRSNLSNRLLLKYGERRFTIIRKSISAFYQFAQWFFPVGPKKELYKAAREYLHNNSVDAIIATGEPFILFKYAADLSKEFNIPWIGDYRDPWVHNQSRSSNAIVEAFDAYQQKLRCSSAAFLTTVSPYFRKHIQQDLPEANFEIVRNGFDSEVIDALKSENQSSDKLRIAIIGSILPYHPLSRVLEALSEYVTDNPDAPLELCFYGTNKNEEIRAALMNEYQIIKGNVVLFDKMENHKLLKELKKCNALLLFNYYYVVGTKIYDYLGLNRKILFCFTNDPEAEKLKSEMYHIRELEGISPRPQEDLLEETGAGVLVSDKDELITIFDQLCDQFNKEGKITEPNNDVGEYSRSYQARLLSAILNKAVA